MEAKSVNTFAPVRNTWHKLLTIRHTELIHISPTSGIAKKGFGYVANGLKNRVIEIALVISTLFAAIYSLLSYPIRNYLAHKHVAEVAVPWDTSRLTPREIIEREKLVEKYFDEHPDIYSKISKIETKQITREIVAQMARSERVYGPIVRSFVDHLLEKAHKNGQKLVFMARDGIAYYETAKKLMEKKEYQEKYPNLMKDEALVLGYFSRKVVEKAASNDEDKKLFNKHVEQLQIKEGDACLFVDIGFKGSMIPNIRKLIPGVKIDFQYLIATSNRAEGYLANPENPLSNFGVAGACLAGHWLEESHHGTLAPTESLVETPEGKVFPNTLYPQVKYMDPEFSPPYLIRKFCTEGLINHAANIDQVTKPELLKAREIFNDTISKIKWGYLHMGVGWDYNIWDGGPI